MNHGTTTILRVLAAECVRLDDLIGDLDAAQWAAPTPAPAWTVTDQVAHLIATFGIATRAATDPAAFATMLAAMPVTFTEVVARATQPYLALPPAELLERWRDQSLAVVQALAAVPAGAEVPWLAHPVSAGTLAGVGLTELFGHGQDIADALNRRREHTDQVRHLVDFAVRAWDFGYPARSLPAPAVAPRFELTAPSGARWCFGPEDDTDCVRGDAVDFCLLVTRRRHRDDLRLSATGAVAEHWLTIAQAFRGPPGPDRQRGQFARSG